VSTNESEPRDSGNRTHSDVEEQNDDSGRFGKHTHVTHTHVEDTGSASGKNEGDDEVGKGQYKSRSSPGWISQRSQDMSECALECAPAYTSPSFFPLSGPSQMVRLNDMHTCVHIYVCIYTYNINIYVYVYT